MPNTMTLISTQSVSGVIGIDFTSISQNYTDLLLVISGRSNQSATTFGFLSFWVNGSRSGYTERVLNGNGSSVTSFTNASATQWSFNPSLPAASATSNTFASIQIYFPNYTGSTAKSVSGESVGENNATTGYQQIHAGVWTGTSAITSISLEVGAYPNTFASGSTASLYGIQKGSGGATVS